jgi:hypothetical protein
MSYFSDGNQMPPDDERRRRVIALWLAVGGSMAVIVAVWALVLPWQLGSVVGSARLDSSRWSVVRPVQAETGFMETLKKMGDDLERLTAQGAKEADGSADSEVPPEVADFIEALNGLRDGRPAAESPVADAEAAAAVNTQDNASQED